MELRAATPAAMRLDGLRTFVAQSCCHSRGELKQVPEAPRRLAASASELAAELRVQLQPLGSKAPARFSSRKACSMPGSVSVRCSIGSHLGQRHTLLPSQQTGLWTDLDICKRECQGPCAPALCSSPHSSGLLVAELFSRTFGAAKIDRGVDSSDYRVACC